MIKKLITYFKKQKADMLAVWFFIAIVYALIIAGMIRSLFFT